LIGFVFDALITFVLVMGSTIMAIIPTIYIVEFFDNYEWGLWSFMALFGSFLVLFILLVTKTFEAFIRKFRS